MSFRPHRIGQIGAACLLATAHAGPALPAEIFTDSLGVDFGQVSASSFLMGSPDDDPEGRAMERPQHEVTISRPFRVVTTGVTQRQWQALMGENSFVRDR